MTARYSIIIYGCPENFRESLATPTATFPEIVNGLLLRSIDRIKVRTKFEVRSFTRSWDKMGYFKTLGSHWICPRCLFSKILLGFCSDGPCELTGQIWSPQLNFARSWDNSGYLKTLGSTWSGYAVQGHPRSLIFVPIESAYATSY